MCVASAVHDSMKAQWPNPLMYAPKLMDTQWTLDDRQMLLDILKKIDLLDKKFDTARCSDDRKDQFINDIEETLRKLKEQQ